MLGAPAVRYADRYFDAVSREVRQQTWRLGEKVAAGWLASRIPTEVLMEGDELLVITSVPTQARGALPSVQAGADGRGLMLRHAHGQDRWIGLPEQVAGEPRCAVSPAGTLVIRGRRRAPGSCGEWSDMTASGRYLYCVIPASRHGARGLRTGAGRGTGTPHPPPGHRRA